MQTSRRHTVVLADDHDVVRYGVRMLLAPRPSFEIVAEVGDIVATGEAVRRHQPSVLVLELNLAGESSLSLIPEIVRAPTRTRVVVHTMHADAEYVRACLDAGACSVVSKEEGTAHLLPALEAAVRGERFLPPSVAARLAASRDGLLTDREREVLHLLASGHTNQQAAAELHCSTRTVETHRARIKAKLGLATRAEMIAYGRNHPV